MPKGIEFEAFRTNTTGSVSDSSSSAASIISDASSLRLSSSQVVSDTPSTVSRQKLLLPFLASKSTYPIVNRGSDYLPDPFFLILNLKIEQPRLV